MNSFYFFVLVSLISSQAFGFGIQIDTSKQPDLSDNLESSIFERARSDNWLRVFTEVVNIEEYLPKLGSPVHENITLEALNDANLGHDYTWTDYNGDTVSGRQQVLRGLLWNDDPDGYLFPKTTFNPKGFSERLNGTAWLLKFIELEFWIHKKDRILSKNNKDDLLKKQKSLQKQIKSFRPVSVSSGIVYDGLTNKLNRVNKKLKEIEDIQDRFNIGDIDKMNELKEEIKDKKRTISIIENQINNPKLSNKEMKKYIKGRAKTKDIQGINNAKKRLVLRLKERQSIVKKQKKKLEKELLREEQFGAIKNNIMYASHFGDLQYLHSMGSDEQSRNEVKRKILSYMQHAWKTASGELPFEEQRKRILKTQREFRETGKGAHKFKNRFAIQDLLYHTKDKEALRYRALGSILHLIQDSYAKGHTVRENWEISKDNERVDESNSGRIRYFQDYSHQGGGHEAHADHDTNKDNPEDFMGIPGAKMAIKRSSQMIKYFMNKCTWENIEKNKECPKDGVKDYLVNTVFELVPEVEPGKIKVEKNEQEVIESTKTRAHENFMP